MTKKVGVATRETVLFVALFLFVAVMSVVVTVGCSRGPWRVEGYTPQEPQIETRGDVGVVTLDKTLAKVLRTAGERTAYTPDSRLMVYVELENTEDKQIEVQIQTVFKDSAGNFTEDTTNWEHVLLTAQSVTLYKATALKKESKSYIVRVKP